MEFIRSRDNAWFKDLRRLTQDNAAYRRQGRIWVEGDHLCRAALGRGWSPEAVVWQASAWADTTVAPEVRRVQADRVRVVADELWGGLSSLESPSRMAMVFTCPPAPAAAGGVATVVLDRLQDAGNVGSVLRSAAAFGYGQVLALKGTAALWSPKVLRAGMGAHFGLRLCEGLESADVLALGLALVVTSSHGGLPLSQAAATRQLPSPCAWVFGHEGQGVSAALMQGASTAVCIEQPGGEESLNVAAAAAICLYHGRLQ